ncbi:hypothetical protein DY000_02018697, partial [Brassica cretica]
MIYFFVEVEDSYLGPRIDGDIVTSDFENQRMIHKRYIYQIVAKAMKIFQPVTSLASISLVDDAHITVCGDIHGQFYDLIHIFELNGFPPKENPYLFNVDVQGFCFFLFAAIYLARGNHESDGLNESFGFHREVSYKVGEQCVELFSQAFCFLPLAHLINDQFFVVHGGLFTHDGVKLSEIRDINRFCQPPDEGLMSDLLWSDPQTSLGRAPSKRGCGVMFGEDVSTKFLTDNNLKLIIRSHEVKDDGFEVMHHGQLITVFSAPNYCGRVNLSLSLPLSLPFYLVFTLL